MALKARQRALAELMVLRPELTNLQYAEEAGIDPKTVYRWKKMPEFQDYVHELCLEKFRSLEQLATEKLRENIIKGNQKAIEYSLDYLGYKADTKIKAEVSDNVTITIE